MDYVILNDEILDSSLANIPIENRAFKYGDAIFETMLTDGKEIRNFNLHWARLVEGMKILSMDYSQVIDIESLKINIGRLLEENKIVGEARIRLEVFRSGLGLYSPATNQIGFLLEANKVTIGYQLNFDERRKINVGFCDTIKLNYSSVSSLKTCNSIPYVLAAIERDNKGFDDLILVNDKDMLAECCSSNLFWWDGNIIYTPSIASGCIAGVMRNFLITHFKADGFRVEEGLYPKISLKSAKLIFTSNCTGIKILSKILNHDEVWCEPESSVFKESQVFASIQSLF